ncbi:unnamed protein product [Ectocarpus fasciculatus]
MTMTTKIMYRRAAAAAAAVAAAAAAEAACEGTTLTPPRPPGTGTTTTTGPPATPACTRTGAGAPGRWRRSATSASRCGRSCRGRGGRGWRPRRWRGAMEGGGGAAAAAAAAAGKKNGGEGRKKKRQRRDCDGGEPGGGGGAPQTGARGARPPSTTTSSCSSSSSINTNMLEFFKGVNWPEVARLMSNGRSDKQCRLKWFEAIDPSVNRQRGWEAEEEARLRKAVEARGVGEWRAVEMDMANWAQKRGMLRRTDHACRRRYISLEPEKHEKHIRYVKDRREVEPRLNAPSFAAHGFGKTEVTLEDFDLVHDDFDGSNDDGGGGGDGGGDNGDIDDEW